MTTAGAMEHSGSEVHITPAAGLVPLNLHELWEYRELAVFLILREVKGRYKQMAIGPLWMIINPLLNMLLFTIIFGMMAKFPSDGVPYPLFAYSALLPWTLFSASAATVSGSLIQYRDLLTKVYFPRLITTVVSVFAALIDFMISFVVLLGMMLYFGYVPGWTVLTLPLFLLLAILTALSIGLWAASLVVYFRDINTIVGYGLRALMYISPVVYASSFVPDNWQTLYHLNPMTNVIIGIRWALLGTGTVDWYMVIVSFCMVIPVVVGGAYFFRRTEMNIVDIA